MFIFHQFSFELVHVQFINKKNITSESLQSQIVVDIICTPVNSECHKIWTSSSASSLVENMLSSVQSSSKN